jgi:hypothetical protein
MVEVGEYDLNQHLTRKDPDVRSIDLGTNESNALVPKR